MERMNKESIQAALKVYFIMGSNNCNKDPETVLEEAIAGGITLFQFREKGKGALDGAAKYDLARRLQQICRMNKIPFIVNDDVGLALELDADGIHIGQDDEPVETIRERIGNKILGVSTHTLEEAEVAVRCGADYLGIGPIFPTSTKEDAKAVQGTSLIDKLRGNGIMIPLVGIGGINASNASMVLKAGADGVSVITSISKAADVTESARQLWFAVIGEQNY
ncbi:thiamine phosphate synthase [Bacillus sp. UNC438CL73TsuS30]|uniref:thiamine phosphate synthase n=1 Tax=Bacillus sp. UNC438CL73TsuS30 TaxID=1340434 RepID=UPI000478CC6B|nr:thiamine phosphate synthase [Bacillus sp. UNC438CL73TsuS30]